MSGGDAAVLKEDQDALLGKRLVLWFMCSPLSFSLDGKKKDDKAG